MVQMRSSWIALPLLSVLNPATAEPSQSAQNACRAIKEALPGKLSYPSESAYTEENKNYWSIAARELQPACIAHPTSANDVSAIVKLLDRHADVRFAVKSGGHSPNVGHAGVQDGVLIALSRLAGTQYDAAKKVAYVKPGGSWQDAFAVLDKDNVAVVGGRLGVVGIGGYLMQAGVSFLTAQYGMGCDNIEEYETVVANGSIVNINAQQHKDLVVAMRGGGDQFGVVTKFTLKAYPIGMVWGGYRIYTPDSRAQLLEAFHDFLGNSADPKAAIIMNVSSGGPRTGMPMVFFFYDGPTPPPGVFDKFFAVKPAQDFTTKRTYLDLLRFNGKGSASDELNKRTSFRTITLPYIESEVGRYKKITDAWQTVFDRNMKNHTDAGATLAFQPWPKSFGRASKARGGNAMGLDVNDHDRFVIEISCMWSDKALDKTIASMSQQFTEQLLEEYATLKSTYQAFGTDVGDYNPLFTNDAAFDQNPFGSYKDVAKFKALQKENDPKGLFSKRSGGFKYS